MYSLSEIFLYVKKWGLKISFQNLMYSIQNREVKKCLGKKNPDKTIYIIRCINDKSKFYNGPIFNLMANYFYVLTHLCYAKEKGYLPVVDQQNYPVYNSLSKPVNGTNNAWEYFWKQPAKISLEDAYQSKNVVLSRRKLLQKWDMGYDSKKYKNPEIVNLINSFMISLNNETEVYVKRKEKELIHGQGKILGVCYRFGGHSKACFYHGNGHPIQPEMTELADIVEKRMFEWNMDKCFFTSDSIESVTYFKNRFKNNVIIMERTRQHENDKTRLKDSLMYCEKNMYQTCLDYLSEMEILSRCDCFIGSITSGMRYAIVKNNMNYEHCEILERGFFEDRRREVEKK